jgi:hypothetical protein
MALAWKHGVIQVDRRKQAVGVDAARDPAVVLNITPTRLETRVQRVAQRLQVPHRDHSIDCAQKKHKSIQKKSSAVLKRPTQKGVLLRDRVTRRLKEEVARARNDHRGQQGRDRAVGARLFLRRLSLADRLVVGKRRRSRVGARFLFHVRDDNRRNRKRGSRDSAHFLLCVRGDNGSDRGRGGSGLSDAFDAAS